MNWFVVIGAAIVTYVIAAWLDEEDDEEFEQYLRDEDKRK